MQAYSQFPSASMNAVRTMAIFFLSGICVGQQSFTLADFLQRKLNHIQENARLVQCDQTPTVITEDEINDYFAAGRVKLPQGVKRLAFQGQSGVVTALASIDFGEIRSGEQSSNPLLAIFSGTRNVRVQADASGWGGRGKVHLRDVTVDGLEVPRIALEFFLSRYVTPKHPSVGMDSDFPLPDRIDAATIGYHKLTIGQK